MNRFLVVVFAVVVGLSAVAAKAQVPYLQIYFDEKATVTMRDCPDDPPMTVLDTAYVYAHNWNNFISAMEFRVVYPAEVVWVGDLVPDRYDTDPIPPPSPTTQCVLKVGSSPGPTGVAVAWNTDFPCRWPRGWDIFQVLRIQFFWNCQGCNPPVDVALPIVNASDILDYTVNGVAIAPEVPPWNVFGVGLTAYVCPDFYIPVEETTWGGIKALYRD
jgi:hypothetical protein